MVHTQKLLAGARWRLPLLRTRSSVQTQRARSQTETDSPAESRILVASARDALLSMHCWSRPAAADVGVGASSASLVKRVDDVSRRQKLILFAWVSVYVCCFASPES